MNRPSVRKIRIWHSKTFWGLVSLCFLLGGAGVGALAATGVLPGVSGSPAPNVAGYLAPWDGEAGRQSLRAHGDVLTEVNPVWYGLTAEGALEATGTEDFAALTELANQIEVALVPTFTNSHGGTWNADAVADHLRTAETRDHHAAEIAALAEAHDWAGVDIDYEFLEAADGPAYTAFIADLADHLHQDGRRLSVAVHAKTSDTGVASFQQAHDYEGLGRAADTIRVMTYDHHWAESEPGPIAPVAWVEQVLAYAAERVAPERLALGIAGYGYEWDEEGGRDLLWTEVMDVAADHDEPVQWDEVSRSPWLRYRDGTDAEHTIWFENSRSIAAKLEVAHELGVTDIFLWRLGGEDPDLWETLTAPVPASVE